MQIRNILCILLLPILIIFSAVSCSINKTAAYKKELPLSILSEKIKSTDKEKKWEALSYLEDKHYNDNPEIVNFLTYSLKDNDPEIRLKAVQILANNNIVEPLIPLLTIDNDWLIRAEIIKALYEAKKNNALPYLKTAMLDKEPSVREEAVSYISKIKTRNTIPILISALNDSSRDVKRKAINALASFGLEEPIINLFNDNDPLVKEEVLKVLVEIQSPAASNLLLMGLWDERVNIRRRSAYFLNQKKYKHSLEPLIGALNDSDIIVRMYTAEALGNLGDQRALSPLLEALTNTKDNSLINVVKNSINKLKPVEELPEEAVAHYKKGIAHQNRRELEKALAEYEEAVKIYPNYSDARYSIGKIYYQQNLTGHAVNEFKKALLNPYNSKPELCYVELGNIYFENFLYDEAVTEYKKALSIKKDNAAAHNGLGMVYKKKRLYEMAVAEFRESINIDRNYAAAYKNIGDIFFDLKRYDVALKEYKSALKANQLDPEVRNSIGNIYNIKGLYDAAIFEYKEALNVMDYNNREIFHSNLSRIYNKKKMYEQAIAEAKKAIRLKPDYAEAHMNLGYSYIEKNMYDKAVEEFKNAIRLKPGIAEAHNNLGWAYEQLGEHNLAVDEYTKAVQAYPSWELPKNNLRRVRKNN